MILFVCINCQKIEKSFEVLVVDDGSNKMSKDALETMKRLVPNLRVVHHNKNTGYGGALRSGFKKSQGKLIFIPTVTLNTTCELSKLFAVYRPGTGLVNGYKKVRHDPWYIEPFWEEFTITRLK